MTNKNSLTLKGCHITLTAYYRLVKVFTYYLSVIISLQLSVVVIGAGAAGLAAARHLNTFGVKVQYLKETLIHVQCVNHCICYRSNLNSG